MTERRERPDLLIRGKDVAAGEVVSVTRDRSGCKYIDFRVLRLAVGQHESGQTGGDEVALVVITGTVSITSSAGAWDRVGERADPFSGPPTAVYLPPDTSYEIRAESSAEIAICAAPARAVLPARRIVCTAESAYVRGEGHAQRRIHNIMMGEDEASSLFLTEVVTFPGNWSSYPPHKHDEDDPPRESQLEEVYYYRAQPAAGFAFQRVYTKDGELDETVTAHDCDAVLVPRGFHVCAAAAGYWIYYLNVLAGPKHVYHMTFDPAHAWIKEGWRW